MAIKLSALCVAAAGTLIAAASASAALSDPFILVRASNAEGSGLLSIPLVDTTPGPNGSTVYSLAAPVDIMDGPNVIATITQLNSIVVPTSGAQPNTVSLAFTFFAGSSDTRFIVDSTVFTFDPLLNEAARATAGISLTDSNGDGASLTGNGARGTLYTAYYNGGSSTFASLLAGPFAAGSGQTTNDDDRSPTSPGFTALGVNADDMSASWDFTLSAGDQIGVTSSYFMVPAPGALALLGLAGLTIARRTRR